MNPMFAASELAVNGLYLALTALVIAGTNILTAWWAMRAASAATAKLDSIASTAEKTHTLVNSQMGYQLKMHATVTRRLAAITGDPADKEAAGQAEQLLKEHDEKQATVDANVKTP